MAAAGPGDIDWGSIDFNLLADQPLPSEPMDVEQAVNPILGPVLLPAPESHVAPSLPPPTVPDVDPDRESQFWRNLKQALQQGQPLPQPAAQLQAARVPDTVFAVPDVAGSAESPRKRAAAPVEEEKRAVVPKVMRPATRCRLEESFTRRDTKFVGWSHGVAPPTKTALETFVGWRLDLSRLVRTALKSFPVTTCFSKIVPRDMKAPVGKGMYGKVVSVSLDNVPFPVAVKIFKLELHDAPVEKAEEYFQEVTAMVHLNALVSLQMCPNFPLLYETFLCMPTSSSRLTGEMALFMEQADGELQNWLKVRRTKLQLYQLFFQVFAAIVTYQSILNVVNNDIKTTNILYVNVQEGTRLQYTMYGKAYCLTTDVEFLVADWGLSTGPITNPDHAFPPSLVETEVTLPAWSDPKAWSNEVYLHHPLAFRVNGSALPHEKRDYLMLVYMLLNVQPPVQPNMPREFLHAVAKTIQSNRTLRSGAAAHGRLLHEVFSEQFIGTFDPDMAQIFRPDAQPLPYTSEHNFTVDETILVPQLATHAVKKAARKALPALRCS